MISKRDREPALVAKCINQSSKNHLRSSCISSSTYICLTKAGFFLCRYGCVANHEALFQVGCFALTDSGRFGALSRLALKSK